MGKNCREFINGWINLDKPRGITSAKAVGVVRRGLNASKAGHAGTLDPLASGVLPIALGEATKTVSFMVGKSKTYEFSLKWGVETSTDDVEGHVVNTSDYMPGAQEIKRALQDFIGEIYQVPPMYSAIKIRGERAYSLARKAKLKDKAQELPPRKVKVNEFRLLDITSDGARFFVDCGKGTYIRALARDLARKIGTVGHVTNLRRNSVGSFFVENAISLDFFERLPHSASAVTHLRPVISALDDIPAFSISGKEATKLRHGQTLPAHNDRFKSLANGVPGIAIQDKSPVALIILKAGVVRPVRVLNI